jgi:hypothetical protein
MTGEICSTAKKRRLSLSPQDLRYPIVQTVFQPPEEIRHGPCADGHAVALRKERGQTLVAGDMRILPPYYQVLTGQRSSDSMRGVEE